MYHGSKTKSHQWGSWSDWGWDEKHHSFYRVRQDAEGNLDYDWAPREELTTAVHAQTPRDSTIEDVAEHFERLSTNLSTDTHEQSSENQAAELRPSRTRSKHKHGRSSSSSYGKDTHPADYSACAADSAPAHHSQAARDDYETGQYVHGSSIAASAYPRYQRDSRPATYADPPEILDHVDNGQAMMTTTSRSTSSAAEISSNAYESKNASARYDNREPPSSDHEAELAESIAASQSYTYNPYHSVGESSSSSTYAPYDETEDEGPPTPKAQEGHGGYHIAAFEESLEELDPRYRVEPSSKFQPGEIFKVHWSEPQGSGNDGAPSVSGKHEIQNRFGTKFFVGFRRFIVIANDQGHCTCVPILTYGGKACKKKGVKADKHGIIHERGHKARLLEKEPKLGFPPVRVEMKEDGEKLSKESRVNYSKLVTVEHNVKVFFIGSVVYNDWDLVRDAVNQCWNRKNHQKQRHR